MAKIFDENKNRRIRDKYESELREVEKTERETMERYNNIKANFNEIEGEYERLKVVCKQKEKDLEGIKKVKQTTYSFILYRNGP